MKSVKLLITALLLTITAGLYAQNVQVTGTVYDDEGTTLPGAAVKVVGTATVAVTDLDGNFSIKAPANGTLEVSFTGFKTVQVPINGKSVVNVTMETDAVLLEEAIVVGYGTAKKISSVVGAASTVKAKTLQNRPVANVGDALQGQVSGLQVFSSTGEPSATVTMRLRGVNSINASNSPLYVLDGSPVSASIFTTLNPNDIENITVLKDASSTAIYGSRAANGVVYITTKKGTSEKPVFKVGASYSISNIAEYPVKLMTSEELFRFREMADPSLKENAQFQELKNFRLKNNIGINWREWILNENAPTWSADMSVAGRTKATEYYISLGAFSTEGIEPGSEMDRYSMRTNVSSKLNSWLKVGVNLNLTYQEMNTAGYSTQRNGWYNPINLATWSLPYTVPYEILTDDNGNFLGYGEEQNYMDDWGGWNYFFYVGIQPTVNTYTRLNGNTFEEITPIKGLVFRATQAVEAYDYTGTSTVLPNDEGALSTYWGSEESFNRYYRMTATNTAEYKFKIGENNNFVALLGQEAIISNEEGFGASSTGHTDVRMMNVNQGTIFGKPEYSKSETSYNSLFARLSYDYNDKYFFDATFRRDGSSLFGANRRWANFWSVGAMWNAKKESFLKNADWINTLQLRASYGTTGNSGIDNYLSLGLVADGALYDGNPTLGLSSVSNPDLTWETIESLNVGINARLWDKFSANIEFYNKLTKDMLMQIPFSYSTGFAAGWGNVGNMVNRGVDLEFGYDIINNKDFYLNVTVNANYTKNEITALFGGRDEFVVPNTGVKYQTGHPYGELFLVKYAGVDPSNGAQLWYDKDGNLTTEYSEDNAVFLGKNRFAPWSGGLSLNFSWKGLSFTTQFSGVFDKWMTNNDRYFIENPAFATDQNVSPVLFDMWTTPGQITDIPAADQTRKIDSRYVENASFVRMKNIQLSYELPQNIVQRSGILSRARVYVTGRNLLTFTKYTGYDPEPDTNVSLGIYPNSKQYSFGVELTF